MFHDQDLIAHYTMRLQQEHGRNLLSESLMQHESWREQECINLLASDGPMSVEARHLLASPLGSRTAAGHIGEAQRFFAGTHYIDQIEALCHALCLRLFHCRFVEHRLLGGTQANQIVYISLLNRGDTVLSVSPKHGGDSSTHRESLLSILGINLIDIPFDRDNNVDLTSLEMLLQIKKPKLLSLGFSLSLKPLEYQKIIMLCHHYGVLCHADCAHELGLIAGQAFPNPLNFGIDVMTGSTGKTLSGPPGGLLLWNNEKLTKKFVPNTFPYSVGGYQNNRIAALTLTLTELYDFGQQYMQQAIGNAQILAQYFRDNHLNVWGEPPFTQTHQILLEIDGDNRAVMRYLESCHLITSITDIPGSKDKNTGLRLGLMECTRMGMGKKEMGSIADFITCALGTQEQPKTIAKAIKMFRRAFSTLFYCHNHPHP